MDASKFIRWGKPDKFPAPFTGRSTTGSQSSKYSVAKGGMPIVNRISYTVVNLILRKYNLEEKIENDVAIGTTANSFVVERNLLSLDGNVTYRIAIYDTVKKVVSCFDVNGDTNAIEMFDTSHASVTLLLSLWEELLSDEEFFNSYNTFVASYKLGNLDDAWLHMQILSDNVYRRLTRDMISFEVNKDLNAKTVSQNIAKNVYVPTCVISGEFKFLKKADIQKRTTIKLEDYVGQYAFSSRTFTKEEERMIKDNRLDEFYIVDETDIEICRDIKETTNTRNPFRTFTFSGPPGTGKSSKAKSISNGVGLPEIIFSCHPGTEIFDFVGQILPPEMDNLEKESWDFAARIEELGGLNFANIAKVHDLPVVEDILACPTEVFFDITGQRKTDLGKMPTVDDAVKAWTVQMYKKYNEALRYLQVSLKSGASFRFVKADFMKAVESGYVIEVQEPTTVVNQSVFVGINSLLNEGVYTLQTGETVYRHPDNIIIFTTNVDLEGLHDMNVSFLDRSQEVYNIQKPDLSDVCDRVMNISGNKDRAMVMEIVKLCDSIERAMKKEGITDGICGIRSCINWATKAVYTNPYKAALSTVIAKTSLREENQQKMLRKLDESIFFKYKNQ